MGCANDDEAAEAKRLAEITRPASPKRPMARSGFFRRDRWSVSVPTSVLVSAWLTAVVHAQMPTPSAAPSASARPTADQPVAVRVGEQELSVAQLEARLAALTDAQRRQLGPHRRIVVKNYVDSIAVPELLLAEAARKQKIAEQASFRDFRNEALRRSLLETLHGEVAEEAIAEAKIEKYYKSHEHEFFAPRAIQIWRIRVDAEAQAKKLLSELDPGVASSLTVKRWADVAREQSTDEATKYRNGDLGLIDAEGHSSFPQVRVDPALFAAADRVGDGQVVKKPVPEGKSFAIVWRRGTRPEARTSLNEAKPQIVAALRRAAVRVRRDALLDGLRKAQLEGFTPEALDAFEPDPPALGKKPITQPPALSANPAPSASPRGQR